MAIEPFGNREVNVSSQDQLVPADPNGAGKSTLLKTMRGILDPVFE